VKHVLTSDDLNAFEAGITQEQEATPISFLYMGA
jgi:hypothetical protein